MNREVVVTGFGAVTPLGVGARTLYERWRAGVSGIEDGVGAPPSSSPPSTSPRRRCAAPTASRSSRLVSSDEALREAGWDGGAAVRRRPHRLPDRHRHRRHRHARARQRRAARDGPEGRVAAVDPAADGQRRRGAVSMRHGLRGQSFATLSACAAGAHAIGTAPA
jgi:3-oxoacyl-[acyl-carrier-protein] synthase II